MLTNIVIVEKGFLCMYTIDYKNVFFFTVGDLIIKLMNGVLICGGVALVTISFVASCKLVIIDLFAINKLFHSCMLKVSHLITV